MNSDNNQRNSAPSAQGGDQQRKNNKKKPYYHKKKHRNRDRASKNTEAAKAVELNENTKLVSEEEEDIFAPGIHKLCFACVYRVNNCCNFGMELCDLFHKKLPLMKDR